MKSISSVHQVMWMLLLLWLPMGVEAHVHRTDSLQALLHEQSPEQLVRSLITLAEWTRGEDAEASIRYARQARDLAILLHNNQQLTAALYHMGITFLLQGSFDSAHRVLDQAKRQTPADMPSMKVKVLLGLAEIHQRTLESDSAWYHYEKARLLAESQGQDDQLAAIYNGLAMVASDRSQIDTAVALYFKAMSYYRDQENLLDAAIVMGNISSIAINTQQYDLALTYLDTAMVIARNAAYLQGMLSFYVNRAVCFRRLGRQDEAASQLDSALMLSRRGGFRRQEAITWHTLGGLYLDMNRDQEGKQALLRSMQLSDSIGLTMGLMANQLVLGRYYFETHQNDSALYFDRKALDISMRLTMLQPAVQGYAQIIEVFRSMGSFDSALYYQEERSELQEQLRSQKAEGQLATLEQRYEEQQQHNYITRMGAENALMKVRIRLLLAMTLLLLLVFMFVWVYRRDRNLELEMMSELRETHHSRLQQDHVRQDKDLMVNAMQLAQLHEMAGRAADGLRQLQPSVSPQEQKTISELIARIEGELTQKAWEEFETRFTRVHDDFYGRLQKRYPELSPAEIKVCSFIRLNLTTKDIAALTNRSVRTVETNRYHIRRKMNLLNDDSLVDVLLGI